MTYASIYLLWLHIYCIYVCLVCICEPFCLVFKRFIRPNEPRLQYQTKRMQEWQTSKMHILKGRKKKIIIIKIIHSTLVHPLHTHAHIHHVDVMIMFDVDKHTQKKKKNGYQQNFFFFFVVVLTEECVELFLLFTSDVRTNTNMCYIFSIYEVVILIVIRCFAVARVNQRWGVHLTHSCAITISCSRQIHRSPSK